MAGFFGFFDYAKPGKGVQKDGPQKSRVTVFFEIFTRKFWQLLKLNLLFFVFNIPAMLAAIYIVPILIEDSGNANVFGYRLLTGAILMCIPVITVGPAQAGFTYVLRNYGREEHAWIWSDFKEHALKNFKQSMIISVIDAVIILIVSIDIHLYGSLGLSSQITNVINSLFVLSFVIFMIMHMYIYPLLVTFELSIKQVYKNAFIFSIIKIIPNLGILLVSMAAIYASMYYTYVGTLLLPLITFSSIGLITNFYVYPQLKKYLIDKVENKSTDIQA